MTDSNLIRSKLYDNVEDFFELGGSAVMKLTPEAAKLVINEASKRNLFVWVVEAGHWLNPGFQPDSSARWDSKSELEKVNDFITNNNLALENVVSDEEEGYNAFIVTIRPH